MKTFCVQTLGCKVNHYEGEQIAALLRSFGLVETDGSHADLRVVNTCSVTVESAAKSRQITRRLVRLPLMHNGGGGPALEEKSRPAAPPTSGPPTSGLPPRVIVTGCWATSDRADAARLAGVDAVITHHDDVAAELRRLLDLWQGGRHHGRNEDATGRGDSDTGHSSRPRREERHAPAGLTAEPLPQRLRDDEWITKAGLAAGNLAGPSKAESGKKVNLQMAPPAVETGPENASDPPKIRAAAGTFGLPLLDARQGGRQRAVLKIQDGCDAHCTYCIIPRLRPVLRSKSVADAVEEARRLVAAGHVEIVLTGIFLSAYGRATALRRRREPGEADPLAELVTALCTRVPGLRRLRLSSLEPGDLDAGLLAVLRDHAQVVPHFHLPLQSGSDAILRRMNRQYTRDDFLRMLDRVRGAFERPALTTDVITGFPGEADADFAMTLDVVDRAGFIHVHAFPYSPRPGTAAARWKGRFVHGSVANDRIDELRRRAAAHDVAFRRQFVGGVVELLVENDGARRDEAGYLPHGRCERYFDVHFDAPRARPGDFARVRIDAVTPVRTHGTLLSLESRGGGVA